MSRPAIQIFKLNENLEVCECHPDSERRFNHWRLWDKRAAYNIVMEAKTKEEALIEAIDYWAERFRNLECVYSDLRTKVDSFVKAVAPEEDNE